MKEKINREGAIKDFEEISRKFGVDKEEMATLRRLIAEAENQEQLDNIVGESAINHDPFNNESFEIIDTEGIKPKVYGIKNNFSMTGW